MNTMPSIYTSNYPSFSDSLTAYINQVNAFPMLSDEEEKSLFNRFQKDNDLEAAQTIVLSHLRFVVHIAKSYAGYGLPLEDIVQEGNAGLMKSVKRFDLSHGVRLASFAVHWIKAEIHEYVLRNWRLVRVATTKAQRKLFFNLRRAKQSLNFLTQDEATAIAEDLNVPTKDVLEMEARLHQNDCHFDPSYGDKIEDIDNYSLAKSSCLADQRSAPDALHELEQHTIQVRNFLANGLNKLDDRSRDIIESRWLNEEKLGLKELSLKYDISMERVRQIEKKALDKLKTLGTLNR